MATSGSFKERKRKPESVQFWLAIAAVSLLFHAGLIVGLKRWATIAVVEPDGGSIVVELVDPASEADAPPGEPIVQAAALKPDAKPAPEPIASPEPEIPSSFEPKFEPEPIVKPEPIVPPEKKPQPIVPKPQKTNPSKPIVPDPPKTSKPSQPKTPSTNPTRPAQPAVPPTIPTNLPNLNGHGKTRSFTTSIGPEGPQQLPTGGADDRKATLVLQQPLPPLVISSDFVNDVAQTMHVAVTFDVKCSSTQGLVCPPNNIQITYQGHAPNVRIDKVNNETDLKDAVEKWLQEEVKASSLVYEPDPLGKTDSIKKPTTYWNIQVEMQVRK